MSEIEIFYLALLVIAFGAFTGYAYKEYGKARIKENQYKLYKLRDDLIYLVASEKLEEKGVIFQELYPVINIWIRSVQELDLSLLFQALNKSRHDIEDKHKIEILQRALDKSNDEVKRAVKEVFTTILRIMVNNSLTLRFAVKLNAEIWKSFARILYQSAIVTKTQKQIYEDYRGYEKIRTRIAYAG